MPRLWRKRSYRTMTGPELNAWRKATGRTINQLAELLGKSYGTIRDYLYNVRPIPDRVARAVEAIRRLEAR